MAMGKPDQMVNQTSQGNVLVQMDTPKNNENMKEDKISDNNLECVIEQIDDN